MPNDKQSRAELVERLLSYAAAISLEDAQVARSLSADCFAAATFIENQASRIEALEAENARLLRTATDRRYMLEAYRAMLGPKALEVVASWNASNVQRVHYDWSQDALTLSGEERAQVILDWEEARKLAVLVENVDATAPTVRFDAALQAARSKE
ncbi:hypothetical protein JP74_02920 [Devosia sp. 17-2-E-8]|nr:hypothetical protein JP74_02920 [Devosia sp. 17-2-E-8]